MARGLSHSIGVGSAVARLSVRDHRTSTAGWSMVLSELAGGTTSAAQFERFAKTYETIVLGVVILMLGVHAGLLAAAFQQSMMAARIIGLTLALSMVVVGNVMPRLRPNWVAGIRAARALTDPDVWRTTHRAFGAALVGSGVLTLVVALAAPRYALVTGLALLVVSCGVASVTIMRASTKPPGIVGEVDHLRG